MYLLPFQGAYAGFFSGLILTLWIGLGAQVYETSANGRPVSTSACMLDTGNGTASEAMTTELFTFTTTTEIPVEER